LDRRRLWFDLDNAAYIRDELKYPGCQIALRVDRDLIASDGTVRLSDTRYFLTSASPDDVSASELLNATRNHWQVENCVFFVKDRWWDEDRHWTKRPGLSQWLAQLTTAATMVLRFSRTTDEPLRALADYICWNPCIGLELLGLL
jgi:predicted transposase YbfD/YdcC